MLGKLLKQEWRSLWKVETLILGILMALTLLAGATFALPIWKSEWVGLQISMMMVILLYYAGVIGASLGCVLYLGIRFYKSMYTDEGYLTHTLPVTSHQLLLSKILVMAAWNLISTLAILASMFVFGLMVASAFETGDITQAFREIYQVLRRMWGMGELQGIGTFAVGMVLLILTSCISGPMLLIGAIAIGQLLRNHRILGSIGAYFGLNTVLQIILTIVMLPSMVKLMLDAENLNSFSSVIGFYNVMYFSMCVIYIAVSVGLYFLSEFLVRKKLELE